MKILLIGIFLICLNGFTGSTFDTITKFLSINNYKWYHYYSIGGTVAIITLLIFLFLQGKIQKHILLKKKEYYILRLLRGLHFVAIGIAIFYSLKYVPINIFTMLLQHFYNIFTIFLQHFYNIFTTFLQHFSFCFEGLRSLKPRHSTGA